MKTIYLIQGITGKYGDRIIWTVGAWENKHDARQALNRLNKWLGEQDAFYDLERDLPQDKYLDLKNPWDSKFRCDHTGSYYSIEEISFHPER